MEFIVAGQGQKDAEAWTQREENLCCRSYPDLPETQQTREQGEHLAMGRPFANIV